MLVWLRGENCTDKVILVNVYDSANVVLEGVANDTPGMLAEVRSLVRGKSYQVAIRPPTTERTGLATLKLEVRIAGHLREYPLYVIVR
jgi:hypothetical protein